jgi:flagellar biosynthesis protein FliR
VLQELLVGELFGVLLVFARVGTAFLLLPGFGERYVFVRHRLLLALLFSALIAAGLRDVLPAMPAEPTALLLLVGQETLIGLLIGFVARFLLAIANAAGTLLAMQSGLAAAAFFDPNEGGQSTLPGNLLTMLALVLLFATESHLLLLQGVAHSYERFAPGAVLPLGDAAQVVAGLTDGALESGLQLAAPLLAATLCLNLLLAAMSRVMPALQVFFIAMPLQIALYVGLSLIGIGGTLTLMRGMLVELLSSPVIGA